MTNPKHLHIGIVGCGWIMRSIYTPTLLALADRVRVAAVCDLNPEAGRAVAGQFPGAAIFTGIHAMLQEAKLDAVMVLTSEKVNAAMAKISLEAGLPVFLEKPPAVNSAELSELAASEARSKGFVYAAFNRRHTPLFLGLDFAEGKIMRISGALKRLMRPVTTFPHTSIHLIDAAQHFGGSPLESWTVDFEKGAAHSTWKIEGKLKNSATVNFEFVPDGAEFCEYLVVETEGGKWELQFPNTIAKVPEGELIVTPADGSPTSTTRGKKSMPSIEAMGFRLCLLAFIDQIERPNASSPHRLASCVSTIHVMEEMEAHAQA